MLDRSTDDTGDNYYYLTSSTPNTEYGLGVGILHQENLGSDNFFAAQWNGKTKFFEGEREKPLDGDKVIITLSGFIPEA